VVGDFIEFIEHRVQFVVQRLKTIEIVFNLLDRVITIPNWGGSRVFEREQQ